MVWLSAPRQQGSGMMVPGAGGDRGRGGMVGMNRRWFLAGGGTAVLAAVGALGADPLGQRRARELDAGAVAAAPGGRLGQRRLVWSVPTAAPLVALTFDDGPDPEFTPRILAVLAAYGARATFNQMGA